MSWEFCASEVCKYPRFNGLLCALGKMQLRDALDNRIDVDVIEVHEEVASLRILSV
jgi:hypothetical protein